MSNNTTIAEQVTNIAFAVNQPDETVAFTLTQLSGVINVAIEMDKLRGKYGYHTPKQPFVEEIAKQSADIVFYTVNPSSGFIAFSRSQLIDVIEYAIEMYKSYFN